MYYQNQKYYLVPLTKEEVEKLQNLRNKEENEKNVKTSSDELIEPLDALVKGNIFKMNIVLIKIILHVQPALQIIVTKKKN